MSENRINLTETCKAAEWHLATTIDKLLAANLPRDDAEAFAAFAFAEQGGGDAEQEVTDEQWDRLELSGEERPSIGRAADWMIIA